MTDCICRPNELRPRSAYEFDSTMAEAESYLEDDSPTSSITSSMVTISHRRSSHLSIFPPINHEGLHMSSHQQQQIPTQNPPPILPNSSSSLSQSSSFSSSASISADSDESDGFADTYAAGPHLDGLKPSPQLPTRAPSSLGGWLGLGLEILRRRALSSASSIPGHGALVAAFRSFPLMSTAAAVYVASMVLLWVRRRQRRSWKHDTDMLMGVIREQDEKIVKLLDHIAQLNEVLLGHQRSQ